MQSTIRISPVYSLFFIRGSDQETQPLPIWGAQTLATNSCITTTSFPEVDGPTDVTLGDLAEVAWDRAPDFESVMQCADREIVTETVEDGVILRLPVASEVVRVCIWRSHPRWPEQVTIGVEPVYGRSFDFTFDSSKATQTTVRLEPGTDSLFFCDSEIPRNERDFNPWNRMEFLRNGYLLGTETTTELTIFTDLPRRLRDQNPEFDTMLLTPSKEVWIFESRRPVKLKVQVLSFQTRLRAWREPSANDERVLVVLDHGDLS